MSDPAAPPPPPPPPPPSGPSPQYRPPEYQPPPGTYQPPPGPPPNYYIQQSPGYVPPPIGPTSGAGMGAINFGSQFSGRAAWSCGIGVLSIVLPFVFQGFYFRVTPIFGIIYGVQAITRGQVIGGSVGIGLCVVGGLVSLFASGLLGH